MGRLKGSKNKPKILPGQQKTSIAIDKPILIQSDNKCQFKALCENNISKYIYNDVCFNPLYCLDNFEGKCSLIILKPIELKTEVKPEETILRPADLKDIKKQIRELKKLKLSLASGCPERIAIGRQIKDLKKKLAKGDIQ